LTSALRRPLLAAVKFISVGGSCRGIVRTSLSLNESFVRSQEISTLALPYWNWSSDRRIPSLFSRQGSVLAKAKRFTRRATCGMARFGYQPNNPLSKALGVEALLANRFMAENFNADFQRVLVEFAGRTQPANTVMAA
jgi:hypothetical protein